MKTYMYFSKSFNSDVQVSYNAHGIFSSMQILNETEQINSDKPKTTLYFKLETFLQAAVENKLKLIEVDRIVTFDMFWKKYEQKDCGRAKAELAWKKLKQEDQIRAYDYINVLNRKLLQSGTAKPYATTYLNQTRWDQ